MKNSAMTIGSAALKLVQDKATITPPKEVAGTVDAFVAKQEAKTAARKRKADVATGAKNSQSDTVGAKGKTTRVEAGKIDVTKIMAMPATLSGTETVGDICARILSVHSDLVAGQITQLEAFIAQGQAITGLRAKLLQTLARQTRKK
jgi:dihydroxyacetone kinase-like predicted kinase